MYPETRKNTYDILVQVRNFLLPLSQKVFRHKESDTQSFKAGFSICPPPRPPPRTAPAARTQRAPKVNRLLQTLKLNSLTFLKSPKSSARASGTWRHSHLLVLFPIWGFYFDISEWHTLSAWTWTPELMLHLTNPCSKRKDLSLTKLKGKIYKTKSLGHYITCLFPYKIKLFVIDDDKLFS